MTRNDVPTQDCLIKGYNRFGGSAEIAGEIEFCNDYTLKDEAGEDLKVYTDEKVLATWYPNEHMFTQFMPLVLRIDSTPTTKVGALYCLDYDGEPEKAHGTTGSTYVMVGSLPVEATKETQFFAINGHVIDLAYDDTTLVTVTAELTNKAGTLDLTPMFSYCAGNENVGISGIWLDGTGMTWADVGICTIKPIATASLSQGASLVLNENAPAGKLTVQPFDTTPSTNTYYNNKYDVAIVTTSQTPASSVVLKIRSVWC